MNNFIKDWINSNQYTEEELKLMETERNIPGILSSNDSYESLCKEWIKYLPYSNLNSNTTITVDDCETNIIDKLFSLYVNDETLVISSNKEHPSVTNNLDKCKNKIILDYENDILKLNYSKIINEISKYKNVFVIIVGTHVSNGMITPQCFFVTLKEILKNVNHKIVLDDAQGIFLVHRDYSIFDYILGTAHATIERYNMGICISNNNQEIGFRYGNWLEEHIKRIDILSKRLYKLSEFRNMMTNYYYNRILHSANFSLYTNPLVSPNIFSIIDKNKLFTNVYEELADNHMELDGIRDGDINYVRFRGQYFVGDDRLYKAIGVVDKFLKFFEEST